MARSIGYRILEVKRLIVLAGIMVGVLGVKKTGNTNSVTSIHKSRKVGEVNESDDNA